MEIGVTQRESFEQCPAYWYYAHVCGEHGWGIVPVTTRVALDWGKAGHAALQVLYGNLALGKPFSESIASAQDAIRDKLPPTFDENSSDLPGALGFVEGYASFYQDDGREWEVIATEWDFAIPATLFYPPALYAQVFPTNGNSTPHVVRGTVDLIARCRNESSEHFGQLMVVDHKCKNRLDTTLEHRMTYWMQPRTYCRAVELTLNEPCRWYVHNQIRKPQGLRPKLATYRTVESAAEFIDRIRQEYLSYPDYTVDYPKGKRGYFLRSVPLEVNPDEPRWLLEMLYLDKRIYDARAALPAAPGYIEPPPWCTRHSPSFACERWNQACTYSPLCSWGHSPATLADYIEREDPHP